MLNSREMLTETNIIVNSSYRFPGLCVVFILSDELG